MAKEFEGAVKPSSIDKDEHLEVGGVGVKRVLSSGFDGTNLQDLTVDTAGHLQVDVLSGGGGGTLVKDNAVVDANNTGVLILGTDGSNYQILKVGSDGAVAVSDNGGNITVDGAVTVTNATAANLKCEATIVNGSINGSGAPTIDSYTHLLISCASAANKLLVSSAANKQIWVYGLGFVASVAGTVAFQDEDDLPITGVMNIDALGGMVVSPSGNYAMPIWKLATDKDLEMDVVTSSIQGWLDYAILSV
jgi:hypothetical protein